MNEYAGYLVGEYAKCVMADGSTFAEGEVIAWHPKPAYVIQQADGTRVSWNDDLVRATRRPTHHDHDIAQAREDECEAIAGWHEGERDLCVAMQRDYQLRGLIELTSGAKDAAHFHQQAAQAIRDGWHHRGKP